MEIKTLKNFFEKIRKQTKNSEIYKNLITK